MSNSEKYIVGISNKLPRCKLVECYCEKYMNESEIASEFDLTRCAVGKLLKLYGIKRDKHLAKSYKNKVAKNRLFEETKQRISRDNLLNFYITENHGYYECLEHFKVTDWIFNRLLDEYGIKKDRSKSFEKGRQKRIERYGEDNIVNQRKAKATIEEKYGEVSIYRSKSGKRAWQDRHDEILGKINDTKQIHNSFNISKPEDLYYRELLKHFKPDDIAKQYRSSSYPFNCDFYIKSLELYIELNLTWTHGGHPFDEDNATDVQTLSEWREKAKISKFYQNAIYTWTDLDVRKLKTFSENKLNYKVYYNINDALADLTNI